ncbi:MAG: alpha amylase C-terminal domain-containing protein [Pseudoramibacter sp.]
MALHTKSWNGSCWKTKSTEISTNTFHDLNKLYVDEPALWQEDHSWDGFQWIEPDNAAQSVIIFRRMGKDPKDDLVVIINFCPESYPDLRYRCAERRHLAADL